MKKLLLSLFLLKQISPLFSQKADFIKNDIDRYIAQGMKDWQLPGLSIVVVKDGKVIFMKGCGVMDIVSKQPVTENSLFMIASNTKLFTATALAQLEHDKQISLDDKYTKYYPDFRLYDSNTTALLTVKDLLCHRIGTETFQGDFTFWNSHLSREQIMEKMRLLKPVGLFRQHYGYCNSCFLAAGEVIPKVTGKEWATYIQDSILTPLQMNNTFTSITKLTSRDNLAKPYTTVFTGTLKQVPYDQWDNLGPAAAIISNVSDLSHWLIFQLDSGRYNYKQVIPFEVLQRTRDINIIMNSRKSNIEPTHFTGYGLGLVVSDYNGRQVYSHTGGAAGMVSVVCFVPEEKLGIAILTNNDNQGFFISLKNQLLDSYLGVKYVDRSKQELQGFNKTMKTVLGYISAWKKRVKGNTPALPLQAYAGRYNNFLYGPIEVSVDDNHLVVKFNGHDNLTARLDYMDSGEWLLQYDNIEYGIFGTFFTIKNNKVVSLETKENDFVELEPYTFLKE